MSLSRNLILVTGAPRTATTPVGNMLASCHATVSLYEPLGPTGLRRFDQWFPMGSDLPADEIETLVRDLQIFRTRGLKSQQRGEVFSWKRAMFGSRTAHSYRLARLQPWSKSVIWKDPHAIMMAPEVAKLGIPVVVTARRAKPHASSYRRLGWTSRAAEIYPRWSAQFGRCEKIEADLCHAADSVISGALLWRMCYLALLRSDVMDKVHLVTADALAQDEEATYEALFKRVQLTPSTATEKLLSRKKSDDRRRPSSNVTHDWNRSVKAVNSYWKDILSDTDIAAVERLTSDIEEQIFS